MVYYSISMKDVVANALWLKSHIVDVIWVLKYKITFTSKEISLHRVHYPISFQVTEIAFDVKTRIVFV